MDYRDNLKPAGPYLALLTPYRARIVTLLAKTYTHAEIAAALGKQVHCIQQTLLNIRVTLQVNTEAELILLAYGLLDGRDFGLALEAAETRRQRSSSDIICPDCGINYIQKITQRCWDCHQARKWSA